MNSLKKNLGFFLAQKKVVRIEAKKGNKYWQNPSKITVQFVDTGFVDLCVAAMEANGGMNKRSMGEPSYRVS